MASARRMGPKGSEIWHAMLDAAEQILRDEGYGALTSRFVADRIGVKQRLVYYYFMTMDELIVETFRRLAVRELERLQNALLSNHKLREIWDVCIQTADTKLVSEFMALANRSEALREEVKAHIEAARTLQVAALTRAFEDSAVPSPVTALATAIIGTSAALAMHREAEIGVTQGHAEALAVISDFIGRFDP